MKKINNFFSLTKNFWVIILSLGMMIGLTFLPGAEWYKNIIMSVLALIITLVLIILPIVGYLILGLGCRSLIVYLVVKKKFDFGYLSIAKILVGLGLYPLGIYLYNIVGFLILKIMDLLNLIYGKHVLTTELSDSSPGWCIGAILALIAVFLHFVPQRGTRADIDATD